MLPLRREGASTHPNIARLCPDGRSEDAGPLTRTRMEIVAEESTRGLRFIEKAHKGCKVGI